MPKERKTPPLRDQLAASRAEATELRARVAELEDRERRYRDAVEFFLVLGTNRDLGAATRALRAVLDLRD